MALYFEPRSLCGSSAALLVDVAPELDRDDPDYPKQLEQRQKLTRAKRKPRGRPPGSKCTAKTARVSST